MLRLVPDAGEPARPDAARAAAAARVLDATGVRIDAAVGWSVSALEHLGCPADLAADVAAILDDARPAPRRGAGTDDAIAPAIDVASPAIAGLSPIGGAPGGVDPPGPVPRGWRRWVRAGRGRTPDARPS